MCIVVASLLGAGFILALAFAAPHIAGPSPDHGVAVLTAAVLCVTPLFWLVLLSLIQPRATTSASRRSRRRYSRPIGWTAFRMILDSASHSALLLIYPFVFLLLVGGVMTGIDYSLYGDAAWSHLRIRFGREYRLYYVMSFLTGFGLGALARLLDLYWALGDIRWAARFRLITTVAATSLGVLALGDNFLDTRWFSFLALALGFVLSYGLLIIAVLIRVFSAANLADLSALLYLHRCDVSRVDRRVLKALSRGKALTAYSWLLLDAFDYQRDRHRLKLAVMTCLRLRLYAGTERLATVGNAALLKKGETPSPTVLGLKAVAQAHQGKFKDALATFQAVHTLEQGNPYVQYHYAYVLWKKGDLASAETELASALSSLSADPTAPPRAQPRRLWQGWQLPIVVTPLLTLRCHVLCDLALEAYPTDKILFASYLAQADSSIASALGHAASIDVEFGIKTGMPIYYAFSRLRLLQRDFALALRGFAHCVWLAGHLGARFHIALLHMIGVRDYSTSLAEFEWILNSLAVGARVRALLDGGEACAATRFHALVSNAVRWADEASQLGGREAVLTQEIILMQALMDRGLPGSVIAEDDSARQRAIELRATLFRGFPPGRVVFNRHWRAELVGARPAN